METRDPALSKTRIAETDTHETLDSAQTVKNHEKLEENVNENKGTDTFEEGIVESEHVNDGDNPARQPCLLYTSPSPRDRQKSRMPSSA